MEGLCKACARTGDPTAEESRGIQCFCGPQSAGRCAVKGGPYICTIAFGGWCSKTETTDRGFGGATEEDHEVHPAIPLQCITPSPHSASHYPPTMDHPITRESITLSAESARHYPPTLHHPKPTHCMILSTVQYPIHGASHYPPIVHHPIPPQCITPSPHNAAPCAPQEH